LLFQLAARRGTTHFAETAALAPPQGLHGLQGLQAPQPFFAAQGLHGLQAFFAAQGLHAPQAFFAAQGLHLAAQGLQAFFAAQGLHAPQAFFAAQGLHLAAHGLHFLAAQGLHAASCVSLGFGFAMGSKPEVPAVGAAAMPGALDDAMPPTMMPTPTNADAIVVDNNLDFNELTVEPPFPVVLLLNKMNIRMTACKFARSAEMQLIKRYQNPVRHRI